jgi:hypothetical protein
MSFENIVSNYPKMPPSLALAGIKNQLADNVMVCLFCGSNDLRSAPHDGQPRCATCGNDGFNPILRSVFLANELREATK